MAKEKGTLLRSLSGWAIINQNMDKPQQCGGRGLLSLPESVIANILTNLPTASKCRAQLVCRTFRDILSQPAPGVWGVIDLADPCFSTESLRAVTT